MPVQVALIIAGRAGHWAGLSLACVSGSLLPGSGWKNQKFIIDKNDGILSPRDVFVQRVCKY